VPGPFGRHTSTRALKDSFAVFSFAVVLFVCYSQAVILKLGPQAFFLFLCYSHRASAGRARPAHCVVGRFGPPERCRKGHAPRRATSRSQRHVALAVGAYRNGRHVYRAPDVSRPRS
jgi:hypothetical protein